MNLVDEFFPRMTSLAQDLSEGVIHEAKKVPHHVVWLSTEAFNAGKDTVNTLARVIRTTEGLNALVRFTNDGLQLMDLIEGVEASTKPIFAVLDQVASIINVGRIFYTISYVVSGKFFQDVSDGEVFPVIAHVAFFARRFITIPDWLVKNTPLPEEAKNWVKDTQEAVSGQIGSLPVFSGVLSIGKARFLDGALITGLAALVVMHAKEALEGKNVVYNIAECASFSADIALAALRMVAVSDPWLEIGGGVIAAGTGLFAAFHNPANNPRR